MGCNFSCPYCHNPDLVRNLVEPLAWTEIQAFLVKRRDILDGVVISGGEPTIHLDLPKYLSEIKSLGYHIKLDTNGSNPEVIETLFSADLIDYVALDLKTDPHSYPDYLLGAKASAKTPGQATFLPENILRSISLLQKRPKAAEFRTTCVSPFINSEIIVSLAKLARGQVPWYLQGYRSTYVLNPVFMAQYPDQPSHTELLSFQKLAKAYLPCHIR
jgi:pyruvate formate lyase activating enzyme